MFKCVARNNTTFKSETGGASPGRTAVGFPAVDLPSYCQGRRRVAQNGTPTEAVAVLAAAPFAAAAPSSVVNLQVTKTATCAGRQQNLLFPFLTTIY